MGNRSGESLAFVEYHVPRQAELSGEKAVGAADYVTCSLMPRAAREWELRCMLGHG